MAALTAIASVGPDLRARRLLFEDGTERTTAAAVVRSLCLEEGSVLDTRCIDEELAGAEAEQARERALRLIGYRERSASEVRTRLVDDGYPTAIASRVVSRLQELQLIDDVRFADMWVRGRSSAGYGQRRIRRELAEKGVAEEVVNDLLSGLSEDEELDRALRSLRSRSIGSRAEREKAIRSLLGKGFDMRTALAAVDRRGAATGSGLDDA
jgi:regulatory protein